MTGIPQRHGSAEDRLRLGPGIARPCAGGWLERMIALGFEIGDAIVVARQVKPPDLFFDGDDEHLTVGGENNVLQNAPWAIAQLVLLVDVEVGQGAAGVGGPENQMVVMAGGGDDALGWLKADRADDVGVG